MFSAARFVLAGAIVALFGGVLVTGVSPTRRDEGLTPAAASPSPAATDGPLGGLVTEAVEPGVVRIVRDGAGHDLDERHPTRRYDMDDLAVGPDGTVWLQSSYDGSDNEANPGKGPILWALGRPGVRDDGPAGTLVPLADGSLLIISDQLTRFDGRVFMPDDGPKQRRLAGDATLWFIEPDDLMGLVADGESVERPLLPLAAIWMDGQFLSVSDFERGVGGESVCSVDGDGVTCAVPRSQARGPVSRGHEHQPGRCGAGWHDLGGG